MVMLRCNHYSVHARHPTKIGLTVRNDRPQKQGKVYRTYTDSLALEINDDPLTIARLEVLKGEM
jgi:hypothetical protein